MKTKWAYLLQLGLFLSILMMFAYGFNATQKKVTQEDLERVKQAVQKAALECYSIEGSYPSSLSYLEEHYGLYLQKDRYTVTYLYDSGNVMPFTGVYAKEAE